VETSQTAYICALFNHSTQQLHFSKQTVTICKQRCIQ